MLKHSALHLAFEAGPNGSTFLFLSNDPATSEIYTLSLHDALPISAISSGSRSWRVYPSVSSPPAPSATRQKGTPSDRKSTRLNSSHPSISYAVFCLKKKKNVNIRRLPNRRDKRQDTPQPDHQQNNA